MVPEMDLLQDIKILREAEVWFYMTGATWPVSFAQVPAATGQHTARSNNQGGRQSEARNGDELRKTFVLLPFHVDPNPPGMWLACDCSISKSRLSPCVV